MEFKSYLGEKGDPLWIREGTKVERRSKTEKEGEKNFLVQQRKKISCPLSKGRETEVLRALDKAKK